ncbi:hypothetical protein Y919_06930 [Caloranaerobacter azorensis H53214]|uniref:Acetyltransferase (GNAT) domain-containing protein n=2 Tax=Caloranaerobacter azorensis TaxID=116090 RepID=A0A1M5UBI6_9FIRM|nr:GNAT family N-acetyltransferase [Caloranaerobacter azorensis]KGG80336.1 hypothetical protein Y919_06930 [Caloranaerobacter azorensis H53214]SHH60053.1 Acetyltransferase (GNAT) domain-containing protein [Caloranaerobacter azorensis DSM 13643]
MQEIINLNGEKYIFKKLSIDNEIQVFDLLSQCDDYFYLVEGRKADESSVKELFEDLPPGKHIDDKNIFGVFYNEKLIGIVDLVQDFPEKGEWIIGLMLLHPDERRKGLGKAIHDIIVDIANEQKAKKLRIGVVEQNEKALKYWKNIGYKEIKRTQPLKYGSKESIVIVMNYFLNAI